MGGVKKKKTRRRTAVKDRPGRGQILVVDDEADFARMIQRSLVQSGYRVDAAVSAAQAIQFQRKKTYDLALVDLKMPEMTGLELLQYLKVRDKRIFVMIMTAYGSLGVGVDSLRQGACDYLSKPFQLQVLKRKVAESLARRARFLEDQRGFSAHATRDEL